MQDQRLPLQPGEPASAFALPAANRAGVVSLADLEGQVLAVEREALVERGHLSCSTALRATRDA